MSTVPSHDSFSLTLNKVISGKGCYITTAECHYAYHWDFEKNMGMANLLSINGVAVNIALYPLGIAGYLDFMSDLAEPVHVNVDGHVISIFRAILDINLSSDDRSAALMLGMEGSCIISTDNFGDEAKARLQA